MLKMFEMERNLSLLLLLWYLLKEKNEEKAADVEVFFEGNKTHCLKTPAMAKMRRLMLVSLNLFTFTASSHMPSIDSVWTMFLDRIQLRTNFAAKKTPQE